MLTYCLKCKKITESVNLKVLKTKNGRTILLSKCAVCSSKKSVSKKEQEAKGFLSSLGIKTRLNKIPLLGDIFCFNSYYQNKMNKIVHEFLTGDKFIPEMHLKQPGFTYSACGPFTKNKERIQNFMQTRNKNYIYKNLVFLHKACFQHDMAYGKYKGLTRRT